MQLYQLTVSANQRPEVLERILRVVRHRGFEIKKLEAHTNEHSVSLDLTVKSERAVSLLTHQLEKLFDVTEVNVKA